MFCVLLPYSALLKHFEEIFRLDENHRKLFCLRFDLLLKDDILKELLSCHVELE